MPIWANSMDQMERKIFKKICQARGTSDTGLFASRISHQLPQCILENGAIQEGLDAFKINWSQILSVLLQLLL